MPFIKGPKPISFRDWQYFVATISVLAVIGSIIYTFRIVKNLISGKYSYENVTTFWRLHILTKYKQTV